MSSVGEEMPKEMERVRGLITLYESVENGHFAATIMKMALNKATVALAQGDIIQILRSYKELKEFGE